MFSSPGSVLPVLCSGWSAVCLHCQLQWLLHWAWWEQHGCWVSPAAQRDHCWLWRGEYIFIFIINLQFLFSFPARFHPTAPPHDRVHEDLPKRSNVILTLLGPPSGSLQRTAGDWSKAETVSGHGISGPSLLFKLPGQQSQRKIAITSHPGRRAWMAEKKWVSNIRANKETWKGGKTHCRGKSLNLTFSRQSSTVSDSLSKQSMTSCQAQQTSVHGTKLLSLSMLGEGIFNISSAGAPKPWWMLLQSSEPGVHDSNKIKTIQQIPSKEEPHCFHQSWREAKYTSAMLTLSQ